MQKKYDEDEMMNFVVRIKSNHYASKLSINNVKNMVPENFEHLVCHIHAEVLPNSSLPTLIKSQVALPREIILELELCTIRHSDIKRQTCMYII